MRRELILIAALGALVSGCSTVGETVGKLNPFASSGPKPAELKPIKATTDVRVLWKYSIGKSGDYVFSPAIVGSSVYVAAADGSIARLDENGAAQWRIKAGQPLSAGVGSDGRLVVVGTPKGEVLAFSASDGKALWKVKVSSEVLAAPAVGDDGVAVKSGDNRIHLLDAKDGSRKWFYQRAVPALSLRSFAPPVFSDRYLVSGFPAGKIVVLDLKNGAPVWEGAVSLPKGATELDRVADIVSTPVVDGNQACAVAFQGKVSCFDLGQGGQLLWSRDISSAAGLAVEGRYVYVSDDKGTVHALDRSSGGSVWKQDNLTNRRLSAPMPRRVLVAVGDLAGIVHLLQREDGGFAARVATDGTPIQAPPQLLGLHFLVQTTGGAVVAIEAR